MPVYLDNQATTPLDPRVLEAMMPYLTDQFGNAGSTSHSFGWDAKEAVDNARTTIANCLHCTPREVVFTSGATESNNLAIRGLAQRRQRRGNHIISVKTEHKAILDPLRRLSRQDYDLTLLDVEPNSNSCANSCAGWLDPQRVEDAIRDDTFLVSVMLANNEIGIVQPIREIAEICQRKGVHLHTDATQAIGKIPFNANELDADLFSLSAHKVYGPKGVGALIVRRRSPMIRLEPQIDGGGQEGGRRSGTLNVPGIVGFARAVKLGVEEMSSESIEHSQLRNALYEGLISNISDVELNGPPLENRIRLAGNLNCSFVGVDGEALMMSMGQLAVSSGSACTSENPEPSHVLRALGLSDDLCRSSLRFGVGRFNTPEDIDFAINTVTEAVMRLRSMI